MPSVMISPHWSARGIACRYHSRQGPDLSPATNSTELRHGSNAKDPHLGRPVRSSLRLWIDDPLIRSTSGRPQVRPTLSERLDRVQRLPVTVGIASCQLVEPPVDLIGEAYLSHAASRTESSQGYTPRPGRPRCDTGTATNPQATTNKSAQRS
jgi:hypothetical protein